MEPHHESAPQQQPQPGSQAEAARHVADARHLLQRLRERLHQHTELDEAIDKLELALSALTTKTGGLL